MKCHACGWNSKHITAINFCPHCGLDNALTAINAEPRKPTTTEKLSTG